MADQLDLGIEAAPSPPPVAPPVARGPHAGRVAFLAGLLSEWIAPGAPRDEFVLLATHTLLSAEEEHARRLRLGP